MSRFESAAAIVLDPEGGEHPCYEMTDGRYWCAGRTGSSVAYLIDRLWDAWFTPPTPCSSFDEYRAMEAMIP